MRLLIVDDHVLFREGLASLFKHNPDFDVVGEAGSVKEAIQASLELRPDLILMDFSLGDGTGLEATQAILANFPEAKIVFLTMHEDDERLFTAIRSGAKGYLLKNIPVTDLINALQAIHRGEAALSSKMTARLIDEFARLSTQGKENRSEFDSLSEREKDVFRELVRGASNQEIAERLFISENTVKNHVHKILTKLNLENRREIIHFANKQGIKKDVN
jgi:two-component system NarL family response regulator